MGAFRKHGAGNGQTLALAAGKRHALLADDGVKALRFLRDEVVSVGMTGGVDDFFIRRAGAAKFDVPADGVVEQNGFLRDDGDLVAEIARGDFADVHAADADGAARRVVEAQEQVGERRFAGAAGADERNKLAGLDAQVDVAQHGFFAVGKIHVVEMNVRAGGLERAGLGGFGHGVLRVQQRKDAFAGGAGLDESDFAAA